MKSFTETVFLNSPGWIRNVVVSLYGLRLERIRYGGQYDKYFHAVMRQYRLSADEIRHNSDIKLQAIVKEASESVPYYREIFNKNRIAAADVKSVADLQKLPLLEKKTIRDRSLDLVNEKFDRKDLHCIHTTGTTSTPLKIYCNNATRQLNFAYFDRFLKQVGFAHRGKRATFWGRLVVHQNQSKPPFWLFSYFQKNLLFSSYHINDRNAPFYVERLRKYKPDYIDAYPSSLFTLANSAKSLGLDLTNITHGITTSAETLFPEQRELIESMFGAPVFDQYGCAEMCVFVGQCKERKYHINTDYGVVEFLQPDGTPAVPGEEAEIVCTGFINRVMPLIRYRIGDWAILSDTPCKCGCNFPVVEKLLGRADDCILTPDGKKIGRLSPVLKNFPVKEAQYIQQENGSVTVLLVKDSGFSDKTGDSVIRELRKRLGNRIEIRLEYVNKIPRGSRGKLRSIISHM